MFFCKGYNDHVWWSDKKMRKKLITFSSFNSFSLYSLCNRLVKTYNFPFCLRRYAIRHLWLSVSPSVSGSCPYLALSTSLLSRGRMGRSQNTEMFYLNFQLDCPCEFSNRNFSMSPIYSYITNGTIIHIVKSKWPQDVTLTSAAAMGPVCTWRRGGEHS